MFGQWFSGGSGGGEVWASLRHEKEPSIAEWEWALGETHSGSRDCKSEGRGALISAGSQQENGIVVLFVSTKTQFHV